MTTRGDLQDLEKLPCVAFDVGMSTDNVLTEGGLLMVGRQIGACWYHGLDS